MAQLQRTVRMETHLKLNKRAQRALELSSKTENVKEFPFFIALF